MFPLLGGLISGGASLLGSIFSSSTSASNTQAQIQASQQQQMMQNEFQERMSNTAYQRASQDMTKAGLNPMMMFGSGAAASSPQGSSIQAPMPQTKSPFADLGENVGKAVSTAVSMKQMDMMTEEIAKMRTQEALTGAQTATEQQRPALVAAETALTSAKEGNIRQDTLRQKLDRARQEFEAIKYLDLSGIPDAARKALNIGAYSGGKVGETISPVLEGVGSAVGVRRLFNDLWRDRASTHTDTRYGKGFSSTEQWRQ